MMFTCRVCASSFDRNHHLQVHIRTVHEKKKLFGCEKCSRLFGQKSHLKRHIQGVHLRKKDFSCELCHKRFAQHSNLLIHVEFQHVRGQTNVQRRRRRRYFLLFLSFFFPWNILSFLFFFLSECCPFFWRTFWKKYTIESKTRAETKNKLYFTFHNWDFNVGIHTGYKYTLCYFRFGHLFFFLFRF